MIYNNYELKKTHHMGLYFQKNEVKTNKVNLNIFVERKMENDLVVKMCWITEQWQPSGVKALDSQSRSPVFKSTG